MSNTLVIHPSDFTTDCLKVVYEGKGWDVINDIRTSDEEVREALKSHDRLIFLGHGTPYGLLCSDGLHRFGRYIIDPSHAPLMEGKETFSVWCNSNEYFEKFGLKGFHTGMIISEIQEEWYCLNRAYLDEEQMNKNMELFCSAVAHGVELSPEECKDLVLNEYRGKDPVTKFNRKNIIVL